MPAYRFTSLRHVMLNKYFVLLTVSGLFDTFITGWGLHNQYISEANPLMSVIYKENPAYFYIYKVALFPLLAFLMRYTADNRFLIWLLRLAAGTYAAVALLHIRWLILLL